MPSILTALTVSDLLYQLGDVPASRVRLQPTPGTASEADVVDVYDREHRLCELVDGVLVEKAMGYYESYVAATLEGVSELLISCQGESRGRLGRVHTAAQPASRVTHV